MTYTMVSGNTSSTTWAWNAGVNLRRVTRGTPLSSRILLLLRWVSNILGSLHIVSVSRKERLDGVSKIFVELELHYDSSATGM